MARPVPPEPPHGYHYEASAKPETTLEWRLASGKKCRSRGGRGKACGRPCVAELNRVRYASYTRSDLRRLPSWWAYCEQHLYGRWIEDGQIMHWVLVEDDP